MESHQPFKKTPSLKIATLAGEMPGNRPGSYEDFLKAFQDQGYGFVFYHEFQKEEPRQIILRHDIDFDTGFALKMAEVEAAMGVRATYFFLLRSNMYNIFSPQDFSNVKKIKALGHEISVHFDPTLYEDFQEGLWQEALMFEASFQEKVRIISFHRPNPFFQNYDSPVKGIEHTYQSKYFRDVKYISDSTGIWRFGHPLDSSEFAQKRSMHVLVHPIWWMIEGETNLAKLDAYFAQRIQGLRQEFFNNCIPFRKTKSAVSAG
jgi:hypothetical protein